VKRVASRTGERLSDTFRVKDSLKQGTALLPLLFDLAEEYAIRQVKETGRIGTEWSISAMGKC